MKTIDIQAREWFDRLNGNSYFSSNITIDNGLETEQSFYIPLTYGYENHYKDFSFEYLIKHSVILDSEKMERLHNYCDRKGIVLNCSKQENCRKRDL